MHKTKAIELISKATMGLSKLPPVTEDELNDANRSLKIKIPDELDEFYRNISNGMVFGRIKILPVKSNKNLKKTADSISRQNDPQHSVWFDQQSLFLENFLVFAVEESYACFAFKANEKFVWYWTIDNEEIQELDLYFWEWLEKSLLQEKKFLRLSP